MLPPSAHKLAEKIVLMTRQDRYAKATDLLVAIESLLSSALEEARLDGDRKLREEASKGLYTPNREAMYEKKIAETYYKAKAEAYEDAAKIAEYHEPLGFIAEQIRNRAKELNGETKA